MSVTVDPQIEEDAGQVVCPPWCLLTERGIDHDCDVIMLDDTLAAVVAHEMSFGLVGFGNEHQVLDGRPSWRTVTLVEYQDTEVTDPAQIEERADLLLSAAEWLRVKP